MPFSALFFFMVEDMDGLWSFCHLFFELSWQKWQLNPKRSWYSMWVQGLVV
uniref:Uncharacterized protein n=1 Tax=Manihot esculenta TaxID=3983 RepID=A0A2C9UMV9_MANES